jgi:hypothetical protein
MIASGTPKIGAGADSVLLESGELLLPGLLVALDA